MEERFLKTPNFENSLMVAAWPGMGYLAKTAVDYLRRQLRAELFAEFLQYQDVVTYKDGVVSIPAVRHRFYSTPEKDIILCIGDAQPTSSEEAYGLASRVVDIAQKCNVKRIYTMAAYPNEYYDSPKVFGVATSEEALGFLKEHGVTIAEADGAINGLNGLLVGVAKAKGIEGICLLGEIKYVNVPQLRSSKALLETLTKLLEVKIDMTMLERRVKRMEYRIKQRMEKYRERGGRANKEPKVPPRYIT
jgi:hypothetical protein